MSKPRKSNRPFCVLTERCKKEEAGEMGKEIQTNRLKDRIKELESQVKELKKHIADHADLRSPADHDQEELRRAFSVMRPAGN
jgi:predicted translin family RNA/ssDNA-binding protein